MAFQKRLEQITREVKEVISTSQEPLTRDDIIEEIVALHCVEFAVPAAESALAVFRRQVASTLRDLAVRNAVQKYQLHGSEVYRIQSVSQPIAAPQPVAGEVYRQQ